MWLFSNLSSILPSCQLYTWSDSTITIRSAVLFLFLVSFLSPHDVLVNSFYCLALTWMSRFKSFKSSLISWERKTFLVCFLQFLGVSSSRMDTSSFPCRLSFLSLVSFFFDSFLPFFLWKSCLGTTSVFCLCLHWIWNVYSQPSHLPLFIWALHASSPLNISLRAECHWFICSLLPSSSCLG